MSAPIEVKPMIEVALALSKRGYQVFPLRPGEKEPPLIREFQNDATRDPRRIKSWWTKWPDANVGISTSRFGRDQALLVVDEDNKHGKDGAGTLRDLAAEGKELPPTYTQDTPSGGRHHVYTVPQAVKQGTNILGEGLDIRSRGGYIVAAGSILGNDQTRMYLVADDRDPVPAPQWVIDDCNAKGSASERDPNASVPVPNVDPVLANARVIEYLTKFAPPAIEGNGGNDTTFRVAAHCRSDGVSAAEALDLMWVHYNPRCKPVWSHAELAEVVANAYRYAKGRQGDAAPEAMFSAVEEPAETVEPTETVALPLKAKRKLTLLRDDPTAKPPALTLVQGLLREQGLSVWAGRPDSGKSTLLQDLAMHVSHGLPWLGRHTTKAAVLYLAFERAEDIQARRNAFYIENELLASDRGTVPFLSADCSGLILSNRETVEMIVAAVSELREAGQAAGLAPGAPVLLIVDTLSRAMGAADENSSADMGAAVLALTEIMTRAKAHVAVAHHLGKTEGRGLRGHSKLEGDTDAVFLLDGAEVVSPKLKGGKSWRIGYEIGAVQVDVDPFGGPVHSTVLRPAEAPQGVASVALSKVAERTLRELEKLVRAAQNDPDTPCAEPTIGEGQWKRACTFIPRQNRPRDFARAVASLELAGLVEELDNERGFYRLAASPRGGMAGADRVLH